MSRPTSGCTPRSADGSIDIGAFQDLGYSVTANSGDSQDTPIDTSFAQPLVATLTENYANAPIPGATITFKPPPSGPSATMGPSASVVTDANGQVSVNAVANAEAGIYIVSAQDASTPIADVAAFVLTNDPPAQMIVTNTNASGPGSLADVITQANAASGTATITITFDPTVFATGQIITLSGELELKNNSAPIVIEGPEAGVTISGGGLSRVFQVDTGVTASFSVLTITDGFSQLAGGAVNNSGTLTLKNCLISGSSASFNGGGLSNYGTASLTDCTISGNSDQNGGGLGNLGQLTLTDCTISDNTAQFAGGGVQNYVGTVSLTNCTISGNSALNGGGLDINNGTTLVAAACTISADTAASGGGIDNGGSSVLTDTIVAGNTTSGNSASDIAGTVSGSFNLIGTGGSGGLTGGVDGNIVGVADADLGPLTRNGGSSQTMAPTPRQPRHRYWNRHPRHHHRPARPTSRLADPGHWRVPDAGGRRFLEPQQSDGRLRYTRGHCLRHPPGRHHRPARRCHDHVRRPHRLRDPQFRRQLLRLLPA